MPFMFGNIIVITINGITFLAASFTLPVSPHIMPKTANRKPDKPIVGSRTLVGSVVERIATSKDAIMLTLFLILQSAARLISKWKILAWQNIYRMRFTKGHPEENPTRKGKHAMQSRLTVIFSGKFLLPANFHFFIIFPILLVKGEYKLQIHRSHKELGGGLQNKELANEP